MGLLGHKQGDWETGKLFASALQNLTYSHINRTGIDSKSRYHFYVLLLFTLYESQTTTGFFVYCVKQLTLSSRVQAL